MHKSLFNALINGSVDFLTVLTVSLHFFSTLEIPFCCQYKCYLCVFCFSFCTINQIIDCCYLMMVTEISL